MDAPFCRVSVFKFPIPGFRAFSARYATARPLRPWTLKRFIIYFYLQKNKNKLPNSHIGSSCSFLRIWGQYFWAASQVALSVSFLWQIYLLSSFLYLLCLYFTPLPQVTEHGDQSDQSKMFDTIIKTNALGFSTYQLFRSLN